MFYRSSMRRALAFTPRPTLSRPQSQAFNLCCLTSALCSHIALITGSFRTGVAPVDLRYDALHPDHRSKTERPLVILHGLLCVFFPHLVLRSGQRCGSKCGSGMKRNWLSLSKAFHRDLQRPVYALVRVASLCPSLSLMESFLAVS